MQLLEVVMARVPLVRLAAMLALGVALHAPDARAADRRDGADADALEDTAQACLEQDRKISRLLNGRFGDWLKGPAPDRKDIAYGSKPREQLDVFLPPRQNGPAPVLVMVHGGGWCVGDKAMKNVTKNKTEHYVARGFVLVSVNYPMIPDGAKALAQAESVARALAYVQHHARDWGGDERRIVVMGHSAGAHLVSLVNADARLRARAGVEPVLGVVSLDSGATNAVVQVRGMTAPQMKERYLEAFGRDEDAWAQASPFHQLDKSAAPWLGVCSTKRKDDPCAQARAYADKAQGLGLKAQVLPQDRSHGAINGDLGAPGAYTDAVDEFIASLDPTLRKALGR